VSRDWFQPVYTLVYSRCITPFLYLEIHTLWSGPQLWILVWNVTGSIDITATERAQCTSSPLSKIKNNMNTGWQKLPLMCQAATRSHQRPWHWHRRFSEHVMTGPSYMLKYIQRRCILWVIDTPCQLKKWWQAQTCMVSHWSRKRGAYELVTRNAVSLKYMLLSFLPPSI
jgi:hypothetical protein